MFLSCSHNRTERVNASAGGSPSCSPSGARTDSGPALFSMWLPRPPWVLSLAIQLNGEGRRGAPTGGVHGLFLGVWLVTLIHTSDCQI